MKKLIFKNFNEFIKYFQIENILTNKYFEEAITHSSVSKKKNYERLEFLGDTILNFCVSQMLFNNFPQDREGELSKKKSYLITRKMCKEIAYQIHLDEKVKFLENGTMNIDNIIADTLESLICVIYQEYDIDRVYDIICSLFQQHIDDFEIDDPKMKLQEYTQKHFQTLPTYTIVKKEGTENNPIFTIEVAVKIVNGKKEKIITALGVGKNKKLAEKDGATILIRKLV